MKLINIKKQIKNKIYDVYCNHLCHRDQASPYDSEVLYVARQSTSNILVAFQEPILTIQKQTINSHAIDFS